MELSFAKNLAKSTQLDQSDYMGCQQQRTTNIDDLKELLRLSERCKDLKLNYLYSVSLSIKYKLKIKVSLESPSGFRSSSQ